MGSPKQSPWRDEEELRKLYHEEELTLQEIADRFECSTTTLGTWMDKFGLQRRGRSGGQTKYPILKNENKLRELHHEKRLSLRAIADRIGCSPATVRVAFNRHGLGIRSAKESRDISKKRRPVPYTTLPSGYERWTDKHKYHSHRVYVHRLLAVAKYGFNAVHDTDVHHRNEIKWDNRPENIELLSRSEHASLHTKERWEREDGPI